jgi:pyruvate kinase
MPPSKVIELIDAGMNVARFNMSHGDHETHLRRLNAVREAAEAAGRPIGIFADLQGPKIRWASSPTARRRSSTVGDRFTITTDDVAGTKERAGTTLHTLTGRREARRPDPDQRRRHRAARPSR